MQKKWRCSKRNKILIVALSDGWSRMGQGAIPPSPSLKTTLVKIGQEKDNRTNFMFRFGPDPFFQHFLDPLQVQPIKTGNQKRIKRGKICTKPGES